jgi:NADH dehydrogenase
MKSDREIAVFVAGGTSFIGSRLLTALRENGYRVLCLARDSGRAALCREKGADVVIGDVLDSDSLRGRLDGMDMVVNLAGIVEEDRGDITLEKIHVGGTKNLVGEAVSAGVKHFFFHSALGASLTSPSRYQRAKAEAEEIVKGSGMAYTIFRPSVVIGERDGFTEKLREVVRLGPVVAVPGDGNAKFQPVDIDDWIKCFMTIIASRDTAGKTYEFGGPEHLTCNELVAQLMEVMGIRKTVIHMPMSFARAGVPFIGLALGLGKFLGKKIPRVSYEELRLIGMDNICDEHSVEKLFGFRPVTFRESVRKFIA